MPSGKSSGDVGITEDQGKMDSSRSCQAMQHLQATSTHVIGFVAIGVSSFHLLIEPSSRPLTGLRDRLQLMQFLTVGGE